MNLGLRGRWVSSEGARASPLTSARVGPARRGPPRRRSLRVGFVNFTVKLPIGSCAGGRGPRCAMPMAPRPAPRRASEAPAPPQAPRRQGPPHPTQRVQQRGLRSARLRFIFMRNASYRLWHAHAARAARRPAASRHRGKGPGRLTSVGFLPDTCWPHRWPYMVGNLRKVVALVKARRQTWPDF